MSDEHLPWRIEGVSDEAREAARRAADAAAMDLGEGIDAANRAGPAGPASGGRDADADAAPVAALLRALESRIAEQDARLMDALQPLAGSLAAIDQRLRALEAGGPVAGGDSVPGDAPPAAAHDGGTGRFDALFGPATPSEDELRAAYATVETDLKGLFDDGSYADRPGEANRPAIFDEAQIPRPGRSRRGTAAQLGAVGALVLVAAGIVAFVWTELASPPETPLPPDKPLAAVEAERPADLPPIPQPADSGEMAAVLPPATLDETDAPPGGQDAGAAPAASGTTAGIAATPTAETVQRVQSLLATLGFDPGSADGVMSIRTRAAIAEYQREFAMTETGEATPGLLRHLREVSGVVE